MNYFKLPILLICLFTVITLGLMSLIAWRQPLHSLADVQLSESPEQPVAVAQNNYFPLICTNESSGEPKEVLAFKPLGEDFTCIPDTSPLL